MTGDLWMELARRVTADERDNRDRAEQMWKAGDVLAALRLRGIADGLDKAREHQLQVSAEARAGHTAEGRPAPIDGAMHSVWLHANWRFLTMKMTTEEREAAADAVQRYNDWLNRHDDDLATQPLNLRWWRDA